MAAFAIRRLKDRTKGLPIKAGAFIWVWLGRIASYAAVLLVVGAAGLYCAASAAPGTALSYQPTFARPHALLAQGKINGSKWRVYAHRSRERYAASRPCIDASIGPLPRPPGWGPFNTICGSVSPIPNVVGATDDSGKSLQTVIAFAFGTEVEAVRLKVDPAGTRVLKTRLLRPKQARAARLLPFRFAVFARAGEFCIRRIQGLANGTVVNDSGSIPCGARHA